jgi:hypothetical protein
MKTQQITGYSLLFVLILFQEVLIGQSKKEFKQERKQKDKIEYDKQYEIMKPFILKLTDQQLASIGFEINKKGVFFTSKNEKPDGINRKTFYCEKNGSGVTIDFSENEEDAQSYFPVMILKGTIPIYTDSDEQNNERIAIFVETQENLYCKKGLTFIFVLSTDLKRKLKSMVTNIEKYIYKK